MSSSSSTEDNVHVGANDRSVPDAYSGARARSTKSSNSTEDDTRDGAYSGTRQSARELTRSTDDNQRSRKSSSSSTEDGEVRAEDNGRRERRKKSSPDEARSSSTSTETALPKSTNTHAGASACTADQYAEDKKSTYTYDGARARPAIGCVADHHAEERTTMEEGLLSLQLIPTRDLQSPTI